MFSLQTIIYTAICIYAPSDALSEATGLSMNFSIIFTCFICTVYTTIGGLKAVIWNDVIQATVIYTGFVSVIAMTLGYMKIGPFDVLEISKQDNRAFDLDTGMDPRLRNSIFSYLIGGWFLWSYMFSTNQSCISRQLSCRSLRHAQMSAFVGAAGSLIIIVLALSRNFEIIIQIFSIDFNFFIIFV